MLGRELGRDQDLVHGRVELDPRIPRAVRFCL
jgi:hypothetical protein